MAAINSLTGAQAGQLNPSQVLLQARQNLGARLAKQNSSTFTTAVANPKSAAAPAAQPVSSSDPSASTGVIGDVDGDGLRTKDDAHAMLAYLFNGGAEPIAMEQADVNGDGTVNVADTISLFEMLRNPPAVAQPEVVPGDVDGDGVQTGRDAKALLSYLFQGGDAPARMDQADANGDGRVTIADAISIYQNVGEQSSSEIAAGTASNNTNVLSNNSNFMRPNLASVFKAYGKP